jgi:hypothetical protein
VATITLTEEVVAQFLLGNEPARLPINRNESASIYVTIQWDRQRLVRAGGDQTPHLDVAAALCMRAGTKRIENSQDILARQNPELGHSGYGVEFEAGQNGRVRTDPQFRKIFTVKVE